MAEVALSIFTAIVIAAISSWITVQLSLRKFRAERWWERKAEAYSKIIEALHNSKAFSDQHLEAEYEARKLPEERSKELRLRAKAAHDEILKNIDVGSFLLSDEALSRLKQYQKEVEQAGKYQMWWQYLEADWSATNECLKDLIEIGKRDLKTK